MEVDAERLASGVTWLARGIAVISLALPLAFAEEPLSLAGSVVGPLGAVAVLVGVLRILGATPATRWAVPLRVLAVVAVPLRVATEVAVLTGRVAVVTPVEAVEGAGAPAAGGPGPWDVVALLTVAVTIVGVIALARHLAGALVGVAGDRWRQVAFGWIGTLVLLPVALLTGALELLLVTGAAAVTAGALLVLSLLATYRAAEDDELDRDFPAPRR